MLMLFFVLPVLAYLLAFVLWPQYRRRLSFWGAPAIALISLAALLYAVNNISLLSDGERIVWAGVKSKTPELVIGGNEETASVGWANGSFAPTVKAVLKDARTELEISGGAGFIRNEKTNEYINGEVIAAGAPKTFGNYSFKKTESFLCGTQLQIWQNENLLIEMAMPRPAKDRVFNFDGLVERAALEITPTGVRKRMIIPWFSSFFCETASGLAAADRLKSLEPLKISLLDTRLLVRQNGEIRFLDAQGAANQTCENPCQLKVLWSNSSNLVEFDRSSPKEGLLLLRFLPPYRNYSPLPKSADAANQLVITGEVAPGEFAYTLPLGKKESAVKRKLDLAQMASLDVEQIPEPFIKKVQSLCEAPTCKMVEGESLFFTFYRIKDLPNLRWFAIFALFSFGAFLYGIYLLKPQPSDEMLWAVCGLMAVLWNFLLLRLMLGMRYAMEPKYFDKYNVGDLTLAFAGLSFLPGFLCLLARLRYDAKQVLEKDEADATIRKCLSYFAFLIIFLLIDVWYVETLWNDLPREFGFSLGKLYWIFGIFLVIYLPAHILVLYKRIYAGEETHPLRVTLRFIFLDMWDLPQKLVGVSQSFWRENLSGEKVFVRRILAFAVVYTAFLMLGGALYLLGLKDYLAFFFCWVPVIFLLGAKTVEKDLAGDFDGQTRTEMLKDFAGKSKNTLAFVAIMLLFFGAIPILFSDAGSIYTNFGIAFLLTLVLLKRSFGSRLFGSNALAVVGLGLVLIFVFYLNFLAFIGVTRHFGEAVPRILAYQKGDDFQHYLLSADSGSSENLAGLNVYDVNNVYLHTWENKSIAYQAGLFGYGYGNAPDRNSLVKPETIQVDSVYSFFVVGDHGFFGGFLLLLLYLMPVLLIYFGNRFKCDVGVTAALIIGGLFALEGVFHAAMNLGVLPYTGRNLPLLAVHSFNSDFLRWGLLFAFLINFLYWRHSAGQDETGCLLTNENRRLTNLAAEDEFPALPPAPPVREPENAEAENAEAENTEPPTTAAKPKISRLRRLNFYRQKYISNKSETWAQIGLLLGFPLFLLGLTSLYWFSAIYRNNELKEFSWGKLESDMNWAISQGVIRVVKDEPENGQSDCPKLIFDEEQFGLRWKDDNGNDFLSQQILRFNSLTCEERIGQGVYPDLMTNLSKVNGFGEYQTFLNNLRQNYKPARRPRRPNVLAVVAADKLTAADTGFRVVFNPDFNIRRTFDIAERKDEIPNFKLGEKTRLIGTAWDKGKYVMAVDNAKLLPWAEWLPGAFTGEWKRLGSTEAAARYGTLTIDEAFHKNALAFVDRKGIELHKQNLAAGGRNVPSKLPSRVGLTVLRLSNGNDHGAVLAAAGFPRPTAGKYWQKVEYGEDTLWLPPVQVVEKRFPPILKRLYGSDRNFEQGTVMGSSTKPVFAAAVLSVHAGLDLQNKFRVAGTAVDDDSVFGIKIGGDARWKGHGSTKTWVDFDTFLTESNNRYQVLFGFLGLADSTLKSDPQAKNKAVKTEPDKSSGSRLETMNNVVWNKIPVFDERIGFSAGNPNEMKDLHKTELALRLRRMFGIGTFRKELADQENEYGQYMNSFWTKNEINDALIRFDNEKSSPETTESIRQSFTPAILPARANFQLNKIKRPRDFVSTLLGGYENKWSNIHAAAGFAAVVTGRPVVPHIVKNDLPPTPYGRLDDFTEISRILRPGLENVVFAPNGTARGRLAGAGALSFLESLKQAGFQIYAKTGTLKDLGNNETTRLILAIVQFEDTAKTKVKKGLVFSIYAENTVEGTSAAWLGEFLVQSRDEIMRVLDIKKLPAPAVSNQKVKSKK